mmetsp:Transcript_1845/g.3793  ORF Transcript_1845/g.3793 Transcript_1845/m.3793 type:complete len:260 (-) Transcript_1845:111-890(-)|eukprot:6204573-Pleurochrysis_carterae.AAC.2
MAALAQKHEQLLYAVLQQLGQDQAQQVSALQKEHEMQQNALLATYLSSFVDPKDTEAVREIESNLLRVLHAEQASQCQAQQVQHGQGPRRRAPPAMYSPATIYTSSPPITNSSAAFPASAPCAAATDARFGAPSAAAPSVSPLDLQRCPLPITAAVANAPSPSTPAESCTAAAAPSQATTLVPAISAPKGALELCCEGPSAKRAKVQQDCAPGLAPVEGAPNGSGSPPPRWEALINAAKCEIGQDDASTARVGRRECIA